MISGIRNKQKKYSQSKSVKERKELGQYFTDSPIAEFMSSLIDINILNPNEVRMLDCGAGYGILTASTAIYLLKNGVNNVQATLYELDSDVINNLIDTLEEVKLLFNEEGKIFEFEEDYISNCDICANCAITSTNLEWDLIGNRLDLYFGDQLVAQYEVLQVNNSIIRYKRFIDYDEDGEEDEIEITGIPYDPYDEFD